VPDVLDYLGRLKDRKVFEFCAIPQVMAIATLADVYNNPLVFKENVKIRKGLACKLMFESANLYQVHTSFHFFATQMENKIPNKNDPITKRTRDLLQQVKTLCKPGLSQGGKVLPAGLMKACNLAAWIIFFISSIYILFRLRTRSQVNPDDLTQATQGSWLMRPSLDLTAVFLTFASVGYLFGFFGIQYV